ncbi:MAG: DUF1330 domain-containing protein [Alphaproteobacteria bacterium]
MKAYVVAVETVKDQAMFDEYRKDVMATLEPYGGRFVVRGGALTVMDGDWPHKRLVIIEFASRADAEGWYHSAPYQKVVGLRIKSTDGGLVIVDGPA